jgi:hypothetical protein
MITLTENDIDPKKQCSVWYMTYIKYNLEIEAVWIPIRGQVNCTTRVKVMKEVHNPIEDEIGDQVGLNLRQHIRNS